MKIRGGFVSNSSSSSFIIAVPRNVISLSQFHDYVFKGNTTYVNPYVYDSKDIACWDSDVVSTIVWRDIKKQYDGKTVDELIEVYASGYSDESVEAEKEIATKYGAKDIYDINGYDKWHEVAILLEKKVANVIASFVKDNPDCYFCIVEYSDNDGQLFSAMEHGDLFVNIPHLKVSHH